MQDERKAIIVDYLASKIAMYKKLLEDHFQALKTATEAEIGMHCEAINRYAMVIKELESFIRDDLEM